MASIITATTTSGLTQSADNSGVLQLASGTGNLVTVPSVTGTAMVSGNMPAFSAYPSANQTSVASATNTLVVLNTEEYDTASCFNNTGSTVGSIPAYAFLPNVAGYYQITGAVAMPVTTNNYGIFPFIYKNGAGYRAGTSGQSNAQMYAQSTISQLIYLNGSTDYVQLYVYGYTNGGTFTVTSNSGAYTSFQAVLVRSA